MEVILPDFMRRPASEDALSEDEKAKSPKTCGLRAFLY
jgi:hypothetical protein